MTDIIKSKVTIETVRQQEKEILDWYEKLNQHGVLLFVGVVAVIGIPDYCLKIFAFGITGVYWVLDLIGNAKQLKVTPFQLNTLNVSDYAENKSLQEEVARAKYECFGFQGNLKCARFWLAGLFILAVFFTELL